jgi:hypothetical protein
MITAAVPSPLTPEQEARVTELVQAGIKAWYGAPLTAKDRDGKTYSPYQADVRGVYGYDAIRDGGLLEKRADALETSVRALQAALQANGVEDDALTAAIADMNAKVADIKAALAKPILP